MVERKKCEVLESHVQPCIALAEACDGTPPLPKQKTRGLFVWALTNVKTGAASRTMYGLKTNSYPKGIIFNFCPWCGADISAAHTPKQAEQQEEPRNG